MRRCVYDRHRWMIVYTALFGKTDPLEEPSVPQSCRLVCFTDQPIESKAWEIIQVPTTPTPTRQARITKTSPHVFFPHEAESLWIDCSFSLSVDAAKIPEQYPADFIVFTHRDRTRITEEAMEIARLGKARSQDVYRQLAQYNEEGFDTQENPQKVLSCNGVVFRRHTPEVIALCDLWKEQLKFTLRDQMSLDYCAWKKGFNLSYWPGKFDNNPIAVYYHTKCPVNDY